MKFFKADKFYNINCIEAVYQYEGHLCVDLCGEQVKLFPSYRSRDIISFCKWLSESDADILYLSSFIENWRYGDYGYLEV